MYRKKTCNKRLADTNKNAVCTGDLAELSINIKLEHSREKKREKARELSPFISI